MRNLKLLLYGHPGIGKTHFLGTAVADPQIFLPMLLIDFEGGTDTIASKVEYVPIDEIGQPVENRITAVRIYRWDDMATIHEMLTRDNPYRTVAIDTLTELETLLLNTIVDLSISGHFGGRGHDPDIPEQRDYLRNAVKMRRLVRAYRDLDCHVILTAHAKGMSDPMTGADMLAPKLTGRLTFEVPALMSQVLYMGRNQETNKRVLVTDNIGKVLAKVRSENTILPVIDATTLGSLYKQIFTVKEV